jgi:hypothetical protein
MGKSLMRFRLDAFRRQAGRCYYSSAPMWHECRALPAHPTDRHPQVASLPGSQIARPSARLGALEWLIYR